MDQYLRDPERDTILLVNGIGGRQQAYFEGAIEKMEEMLGRKLNVLIVTEKRDKSAVKREYKKTWTRVKVNTSSVIQLEKALLPYLDNLLLIVCRPEKAIPYFRNIIPHVPYLATPTMESLKWANDKIDMRRRIRVFNKKISPAYTIVEDASSKSIAKIKRKVGFPAIIKPAGLAASVLVTVAYHEEELEKILNKTYKKVRRVYRQRGRLTKPKILVEQFMEGEMYSTDIYVNSRGTMYTTPLVYVQTGHVVGQKDFFGYRQMTPVALRPHKHHNGFSVAKEAVKALGLRNVTAHVELMRTYKGWKVIEIGPRVGGFRDFLYMESYGIDHTLNDMLIRLPMRPIIPRKSKGYSVAMKFYPEKEGNLKRIVGINKIKKLASYKHHSQSKKRGERVRFARNGGTSVVDVFMFNKKRSELLADIHRIEEILKIEVEKTGKSAIELPKRAFKTLQPNGSR